MAGNNAKTKRKDKDRVVLRKGESQRKSGVYDYRWTTRDGKRHSVYANTLEELREKEEQIWADRRDGIKTEARCTTVNEVFDLWKQLKRGLKDNTYQNYMYLYETYVRPSLGKLRVQSLRKSDVKRFYNTLADERGLKPATLDGVHTVLHQVLDMAVEDQFIRTNPSDDVLRELKQALASLSEPRRALTRQEQDRFLDYIQHSHTYNHWYPIFAVMIGTGMRVGEVIGLRWCDIDLDEGIIDVNHTLIYYDHREQSEKHGCYFNVNTPKTKASNRQIPMLGFVKEAFIMEKEYQKACDIRCEVTIDGYSDFVFVNRFGKTQNHETLNKAIRRIIRDSNLEAAENAKNESPIFLPHFSCHSLRHTFATRMCESGVNIKVIQDALGHADISTTMNIYTDVTKELKKKEFDGLDLFFRNSSGGVNQQ